MFAGTSVFVSLRTWFIVARRVAIWRSITSRRARVVASIGESADELKVWKQRVTKAITPRVVIALGDSLVAIAMACVIS